VTRANQGSKRFVRTTRSDAWLAGVCGGVARYTGLDALLVRVLWIAATVVFLGLGVLLYIILWMVSPGEPGSPPAPPKDVYR
jgi:phage shock protein C